MKDQFPSGTALTSAAITLQCSISTIRAIARVEAGPYGAFLPTLEPVILFEPHLFSRLTKNRYDWARIPTLPDEKDLGNHSDRWRVISRPSWTPGTYGPVSVQHRRLQFAAKLNREAALKSCSWGLFQILGMNHHRAGHSTLQSFINAMYEHVDRHLEAFVKFIVSDAMLNAAVRVNDFKTVALKYNGPGQVVAYSQRLEKAHREELEKERNSKPVPDKD